MSIIKILLHEILAGLFVYYPTTKQQTSKHLSPSPTTLPILTTISVCSKVSGAVMKLFTAMSVVILVLFSVSSGEYLNDEDKDDNRVENKIADNEEVELEERGKKESWKNKDEGQAQALVSASKP
ncbi:hypothetical protein ACHWQZ_G017646 [Mnemiopsis leidyi]